MDFKFQFERKQVNPSDDLLYIISHDVINFTEQILRDYGILNHEGLVYWAGSKNVNTGRNIIDLVIAPYTNSSNLRIETSKKSNLFFLHKLKENNRIYISQVHSHPGNFIDHSFGDDKFAAFLKRGLMSIVVPNYGISGILPLWTCGIHRFEKEGFIRVSKKYIKNHFIISDEIQGKMEDIR